VGQTTGELPDFHPETLLRDWGNGQGFRLADAQTGVCAFGATGSGKTTGPAKHLAYGYLAGDFGGLVLCAKKEERCQWQQWAADCGRSADIVIIDKCAKYRFNFMNWEASRQEEGGGLAINIVSLLDEIGHSVSGTNKSRLSGDHKFWEDALHLLNSNLVELAVCAGVEVSLPRLREILSSAPLTLAQVADPAWKQASSCARHISEADKVTKEGPDDIRADFEECITYWLRDFPALSDKTRSSIVLGFNVLTHPLLTRPLRRLFSTDTNVRPEDTFTGKIIIVDLPVQEFRLAGRIANLVWKYCFQVAVLRRTQPADRKSYLRPVFLWADEAQYFVSRFDAEYQAVARSAGGCTVYLTQNRESLRSVLGDDDAVDSLLGNLQAKFFCQNSSQTNEWAAKLLGERWINVTSTNVGQSASADLQNQQSSNQSSGVTRSEQRRYFVEPARFTTLKRGGAANNYQVQAIVYNGGHLFPTGVAGKEEMLPYKLITFNQR
jgi:hypothetical protein